MKRKGFTLVELLIVVAIIAVLAMMMMMSNTSAVADAEVSAIMGNLRSLKTAALSEYFRSKDYYDTAGTLDPQTDLILAQLGTRSMKGYMVSGDRDNQAVWYAIYNGNPTKEVADKLLTKTDTMGLLYITAATGENATGESVKPGTAVAEDYKSEHAVAGTVVGIKIK